MTLLNVLGGTLFGAWIVCALALWAWRVDKALDKEGNAFDDFLTMLAFVIGAVLFLGVVLGAPFLFWYWATL